VFLFTRERPLCNTTFKLVLATVTGASLSLLAAPSAVMADDVPDALSVEWQGKKPCEKLFEDAQVRIARCTFPPGAVHACHSHPSSLTYVLSGGKAQVQDEKGTRKIDIVTGLATFLLRSMAGSPSGSIRARQWDLPFAPAALS
jgi:hypothetical protein